MSVNFGYCPPTSGAAVGGGGCGTYPVFYPCMNPDGNVGDFPGERMQDGFQTACRIVFALPDDYASGYRVDVVLIPGGTGNLRRSVATDFGQLCAGEQYNTHSESIVAGQVAVTSGEIECLDVTPALTAAAADDLVGLVFTRHADNVNDTVNADVYFEGVVVREPAEE